MVAPRFPFASPLRYPGGKTKLAPTVAAILDASGLGADVCFAEPFAGGAGVATSLLLAGRVAEIALNDADEAVASFWSAALGETERFVDAIRTVPTSADLRRTSRRAFVRVGFRVLLPEPDEPVGNRDRRADRRRRASRSGQTRRPFQPRNARSPRRRARRTSGRDSRFLRRLRDVPSRFAKRDARPPRRRFRRPAVLDARPATLPAFVRRVRTRSTCRRALERRRGALALDLRRRSGDSRALSRRRGATAFRVVLRRPAKDRRGDSFQPILASTDFGGDLRRFPEIALGVDLRRVGVRVSEDDLRRFEAELRPDLRRG